jgi:hypothetical protein
MFIDEEHLNDFSGLKFPTHNTDIKIFERNNLNVSINVNGLKKKIRKITLFTHKKLWMRKK